MRLNREQFRHWDHKAITLLGMSGVGKTRLSALLRNDQWFHYSGDYRIGTRYLNEPILDNIKTQLMQVPFVRSLLLNDAIHIDNNITVDNLTTVSSYLGKLGNPEQGGIGLSDFKQRQALHHQAEIAAMRDVPAFINKARHIYGYDHFINDAGGSLCELDDEATLEILAAHSLVVYIKATEDDEHALIHRAASDPKPMYYREDFLDQQLQEYLRERELEYVALIEPDDFVRWVFPRLFYSRIPRYDTIAQRYGYTVSTVELARVQNCQDFLDLIESKLEN